MPASDLSHTVSIDAPTFEAGWEYSQDQDTNDWSASSMSSISIYDVSPAAPQILRPVVIKCSETIEKVRQRGSLNCFFPVPTNLSWLRHKITYPKPN